MYKNLTDIELLEECKNDLSPDTIESLLASLYGYEKVPPTIETFLTDNYYLGGYFGEGGCNPQWTKIFMDLYPNAYETKYHVVLLRGCIGAGKTTAGCIGILYDLCRLLHMVNPQNSYGLIPTTEILLALFNITLGASEEVIWPKLESMLKASPFFQQYLEAKTSSSNVKFPNNIKFFEGSRIQHSLGKAVFSCILDESNFGVVQDQVINNFFSLIRRMESRFMGTGDGSVPGKVWLISSETDNTSVMDIVSKKYANSPGVYTIQNPIWYYYPSRYKGENFLVYGGSDQRRPYIIEDESDPVITQESDTIIKVPVEHRKAFEEDIDKAIRDLAGKATANNSKIFKLKDRVSKCSQYTNVFSREILFIDFDDDSDTIVNYLEIPELFLNKVNFEYPRYIHIDIGLTGDRLGIASTFAKDKKVTEIFNDITLKASSETLPVFQTDFVVALEAKKGQEIPLYKVRQFIAWLLELGYPIAKVTLDGYQSRDMIQLIRRMGITAELLSMDKDNTPYLTLRDAIYQSRHNLPNNTILRDELFDLETINGKIDHTRDGSKDCADALAGSTYSAHLNFDIDKLVTHYAKPEPANKWGRRFWNV